jgi:thioredoxin 2
VLIACPRCLARNRIPEARRGDHPVCGKCRTELLPAAPLALEGEAFERYVSGSELPVLVDFWAEWCGPCKMMAPEFAAAARQRTDIRFVKLDTERNAPLAGRFGIRSIPTLVLFSSGKEVDRRSGAMSSQQLLAWVDAALAEAAT